MTHPFASTSRGQRESLLALCNEFRDDQAAQKINLMIGMYKQGDGKPYVLPSVKKAKENIFADPSWHHEYRESFIGNKSFREASDRLFFGDKSPVARNKRVATMQTLGGTGACHSAATLLRHHYAPWKFTSPHVFIPQESWTNHAFVFTSLQIRVSFIPYYDPVTGGLDIGAFKAAILNLPPKSVVILQTGAQNPTGCDPSPGQWQHLASVLNELGHLALFDAAYPGFASGDFDEDLYSLRLFVDSEIPVMLAATYGKCFDLYSERVGTLSVVAPDQDIRQRLEIQMRLLARAETGHMPDFGSTIVETILNDHNLDLQWRQEVREMARELQSRRWQLKAKLEALGTPGNWSYITNHKGIYLGLSLRQIHHLRGQHHVYLQLSGRLSIAYEPPPSF
ncbi:pyridoxal phosphate-dependent transferase [Aspergillus pseudoustus]|uniref:Pyridoxal phosphate-dependent transferase n=1 Tax=Aspergillus pseudoustus TaxID=1810923 RepID=A0ABR4K6C7_9EURO